MSEQTDPKNEQPETNVEESSEKTTSTEELGDGGKKALDSERQARREAEKQAKESAERLEKLQKEYDKAQKAADEAAEAKAALEQQALVREVVADTGLPEGAAEFLGDGGRDALVERAEAFKALAESMFAAKRPQPVPEAGQRSAAKLSTADQFAQAFESAYGH